MPEVIDTPAGAQLLRLDSPSFRIAAPEIRHLEIIPDSVAQAMRVSWDRGTFPSGTVTFSLLEDVHVVEEGLVFDASGRLLKGSITQHAPAEIARGFAKVQTAMRDLSAPRRGGTLVLCTKRGARNFGHWLIEMLPKAYFSHRHLASHAPGFIVPAVDGPLREVIADSLAMLRIDASSVLRSGPEPVRYERLILMEGLTHHGVYMSPLVLECLDALAAGVDGKGPEKLFVTRSNLSRRLVNEAEIQRRAVAKGYTLLTPGCLPLAHQIAAFRNARDIIGVMGAELTNIAFAPSGARVLNIAPAGMPDTFVWFIAGLRGHSYSELRCAQAGPIRGVARWDTDLVLDPNDLHDLFGGAA